MKKGLSGLLAASLLCLLLAVPAFAQGEADTTTDGTAANNGTAHTQNARQGGGISGMFGTTDNGGTDWGWLGLLGLIGLAGLFGGNRNRQRS
jgi:MYXO-CTERM domain-containing protein